MNPVFRYAATVERVVDGDTVDVALDLGMRVLMRTRLRLEGVDTPEVSTEDGKVAKAWLAERLPVGALVVVETRKPDKYGRALARLHYDGKDWTQELLAHGMGRPYTGGAR